MGRVEGKVALITGGNSGLGAATAERLVSEGAKVVLTGRDLERGRSVAEAIPGAHFLRQDVRDEGRWREVIEETIARFGALHVLVNNAGLVRSANVEECELEDFRMHQQIMLEGTFLGCKHAIPAIRKSGGGSIINVSSIGGIKGSSGLVAYSAAKAGIFGMTRSIAVHCQEQKYGIRVNSVALMRSAWATRWTLPISCCFSPRTNPGTSPARSW
jgi:3(or 17)beta-hydroxysteroid dehydrogenase